MKIINERVTASQAASESAGPHLTVVPPAQPRQTIERPIEAAAWEDMRFMARCNSQRVAGGYNVKAFYIALASRCSTLEKTDTGSFRIRLCNLLHGLQCSERKFYTLRRKLEEAGLVEIRRTAKSTEVAVIAHRHMAEAPPFQQADSTPGSRIRFHPRVPNQIPPPVAESDSTPGGGIHIQGSVHGVIQGVEREAAPEAPPPPRGTTTTPALSLQPSNAQRECPKCKRSWPANSKAGDTCFDCNATITEIRRRLEAGGKYANIPVTSIGGTDEAASEKAKEEAAIAWREKERERCVERERIAEAKRVDDEQREKERRDQEENPEWQAEQKRKADKAHHLRLETLQAKQNERGYFGEFLQVCENSPNSRFSHGRTV